MSNKPVFGTPKIQIIVGSTQQNRSSDKAASFIFQEIQKSGGNDVEIVDLKDYPLPFYDAAIPPGRLKAMGQEYEDPAVKKWTTKVREADAYVIIAAEYNHGYTAVLKNALDWVYSEWNRKPIGFVGHGNAGGARAIEQLRQVVIELQMVPLSAAIHIPVEIFLAASKESVPVNLDLFKSLKEGPRDRVKHFLDELNWMTRALRNARAENVV